MKIILISIGTRGDIEPFLAIGSMLKKRGHDVACAFPEQFREVVLEEGHRFCGLTRKFLELLESEDGKALMGGKGSVFKRFKSLLRLNKHSKEIAGEYIKEQHDFLLKEKPDRVVYHSKSLYPVLWGYANPGKAIMLNLMPCLVHVVREHPVIAININLGSWLNSLTYKLTNHITSKVVTSYTKVYHKELIGKNVKVNELKKWYVENEKALYAFSPTLFPRPAYWPNHIEIVGYHERIKTNNWQPSETLETFINQFDKILFISFGSMVNTDPPEKTRILIDLIKKNKIPTIINTSWGGLVETKHECEHLHFVSSIPYEWIMPKAYAAIHHGGSGTTHSSLKYGCATMVIPHIMDQFFWNSLVTRSNAGPKGVTIKKLNATRLEPLLLDLWNNGKYKINAQEIGAKMRNEGLEERYIELIEE